MGRSSGYRSTIIIIIIITAIQYDAKCEPLCL